MQPHKKFHPDVYSETKVDNDSRVVEVRRDFLIVKFDVWEIPVKWEVFDFPEGQFARVFAEETVGMEFVNSCFCQDMIEFYNARYQHP